MSSEQDRLIDLCIDLISVARPDGYFIRVNPAFEKTLGWTPQEMLSNPFMEFVHPDDQPGTAYEMERLKSGLQTLNFENRYRCKNGQYKWLSWRCHPADGLYYSVARDVTNEKKQKAKLEELNAALKETTAQLEKKIEEGNQELELKKAALEAETHARHEGENAFGQSEERLRFLVAGVKDHAIFMVDQNGLITMWNEGAQRLMGYRQEEVMGGTISRFFIPEDIAAKKPEKELETASKESYTESEGWRVKKNGSRFWASVGITAHRSAAGEIMGFSKVIRDITEKKRADSAIATHAEALACSNQELEQFAYLASHDLQEPLRAVANNLRRLEEKALGLEDESKEYLNQAKQGVVRMKSLVQGLLEFSRVNRKQTELKDVDCNEALDQALSDLSQAIGQSKAVIEKSEFPHLVGNPTQLRQLFQNFISNSIKFCTQSEPHIQLQVEEKGEEYLFSVKDNGIGIPAKHFERIFVMFQRLHPRDKYEGTGIGLALCKKIVENHGGKIWLESEPEKGTTFFWTIPKKPEGTYETLAH
jgi:PAS domain S-box-containing protein